MVRRVCDAGSAASRPSPAGEVRVQQSAAESVHGVGLIALAVQGVQLAQTAAALAAKRPIFTASVFGQQYTPDY